MKLALDSGERSGRLVAELDGVAKRFGERAIVRELSLRVMRGDRLGVIGPNGAGKSTLLKLILGTLEPDAGTVRRGTRLTVAYFDQMREALDLSNGDISGLFNEGLAVGLYVIIVGIIVAPYIVGLVRGRRSPA